MKHSPETEPTLTTKNKNPSLRGLSEAVRRATGRENKRQVIEDDLLTQYLKQEKGSTRAMVSSFADALGLHRSAHAQQGTRQGTGRILSLKVSDDYQRPINEGRVHLLSPTAIEPYLGTPIVRVGELPTLTIQGRKILVKSVTLEVVGDSEGVSYSTLIINPLAKGKADEIAYTRDAPSEYTNSFIIHIDSDPDTPMEFRGLAFGKRAYSTITPTEDNVPIFLDVLSLDLADQNASASAIPAQTGTAA